MKLRGLAAGVCFWLLLAAPTPGSIGACGGDDLDQPAELSSYCQQRGELTCVRRFLRKEITATERDACRWNAIDTCAMRSFSPNCRPSERQTRACLNALSSLDSLSTQESDLPDCNTNALCGAKVAPQADAGTGQP